MAWCRYDICYLGGGYLGLAGIAEKNINWKKKGRVAEGVGIIITFVICCSGWIFFRSDNLRDAKYIIFHMTENITPFRQYILQGWQAVGMNQYKKIQLGISVFILCIADICQKCGMGIDRVRKLPTVIRWTIYLLMVLCILLFSRKGGVEFVYFQF